MPKLSSWFGQKCFQLGSAVSFHNFWTFFVFQVGYWKNNQSSGKLPRIQQGKLGFLSRPQIHLTFSAARAQGQASGRLSFFLRSDAIENFVSGLNETGFKIFSLRKIFLNSLKFQSHNFLYLAFSSFVFCLSISQLIQNSSVFSSDSF